MCIKTAARPQRGMTLIELIVFIVVVSLGLAGVLTVFNAVVRSSADPLVTKQALAVADSLLEEILLKDFCDPTPAIEVSATLTAGAATVTGISPLLSFPATSYAGWRVSGNGVAAGSQVASVTSATALTLSAAATQSGGNVALRLAPCLPSTTGETRASYDDVRDYHNVAGWQDATDINGNTVFVPSSWYQTQVEVGPPPVGTAGADVVADDVLKVVVSVKAPDGEIYSVTGYRYFYD